MKKTLIALFLAASVSVSALAQSVQEGVNHYYAQRYQSAKSTFEKMLASNPNNSEASYWLGQTYLAQKNIAAAKSLYEKAVAASNNSPLLVAGLGEVYLAEGKKAEARQQFEMAINASHGKKGNDPNVLNAVGRANVDMYTEKDKLGDIDYAIAKLTEAAQLAPTNADVQLNLGNAYRKSRNSSAGGQAVQAYMKAVQLNGGPTTTAVANYRTALLYKTHVNWRSGDDQWRTTLEYLNSAIAADPKFGPAYLELYNYELLAKKNFTTAEKYANQYISSSDPSVENDYLKGQTLWLQDKFDDAIAIGKNILTQTNNNPNPRVYRLLSYSYMGKKDTTAACGYVNEFFTKAEDDDILANDYLLHAQTCARNDANGIMQDVTKAIDRIDETSKKITTLREFAKDAKSANQRNLEATLNQLAFNLEGANANVNRLISEIAVPYYFGGSYEKADSAAQAYSKAAPDSIHGYYWSALANQARDTGAVQKGLAVPSYEKVLSVAETDKVRFKTQGLRAAQTLAVFYNNVKEDKAAALAVIDRGLAFDPTSESLNNFKKALQPKQGAPVQKNSASSSQAKGSKPKTK